MRRIKDESYDNFIKKNIERKGKQGNYVVGKF